MARRQSEKVLRRRTDATEKGRFSVASFPPEF